MAMVAPPGVVITQAACPHHIAVVPAGAAGLPGVAGGSIAPLFETVGVPTASGGCFEPAGTAPRSLTLKSCDSVGVPALLAGVAVGGGAGAGAADGAGAAGAGAGEHGFAGVV